MVDLTTVTSPAATGSMVTTTNPSNPIDQQGTSAENMWALRATSIDPIYKAYVFGLGKMVVYANIANGTTLFYLGRSEAVHAGKTMVIQLFDAGDAAGNSRIQVLKPTAPATARQRSATPRIGRGRTEERHERDLSAGRR